jgi:hypothetical protein
MVQLEDPPLKIAELLNMILHLRFVSKKHQRFQAQIFIKVIIGTIYYLGA